MDIETVKNSIYDAQKCIPTNQYMSNDGSTSALIAIAQAIIYLADKIDDVNKNKTP